MLTLNGGCDPFKSQLVLQDLYQGCPNWGWSDASKREELTHPAARFICVFQTPAASAGAAAAAGGAGRQAAAEAIGVQKSEAAVAAAAQAAADERQQQQGTAQGEQPVSAGGSTGCANICWYCGGVPCLSNNGPGASLSAA